MLLPNGSALTRAAQRREGRPSGNDATAPDGSLPRLERRWAVSGAVRCWAACSIVVPCSSLAIEDGSLVGQRNPSVFRCSPQLDGTLASSRTALASDAERTKLAISPKVLTSLERAYTSVCGRLIDRVRMGGIANCPSHEINPALARRALRCSRLLCRALLVLSARVCI